MVWCEEYFDSLNPLAVTYNCDGQRDNRTDILIANAVLHLLRYAAN